MGGAPSVPLPLPFPFCTSPTEQGPLGRLQPAPGAAPCGEASAPPLERPGPGDGDTGAPRRRSQSTGHLLEATLLEFKPIGGFHDGGVNN